MTMKEATIRPAMESDREGLLALIPSLADFDLPPTRNPDHLWQSDAKLVEKHLDGASDKTILLVADVDGDVAGLALTTLRPELLSEEPSAHLEALAVSEKARGLGLGRKLLQASNESAKEKGAETMTLHVFARNTRARGLYESEGFDGELMRYIKVL